MTRRNHITEELQELGSTLASRELLTPYRVPAGYFDTLADIILLRIKAEAAATPEDEIKTISPLLGGIGRKMPFSIPDGYFEQLVTPIPQNRREEKPARVVSLQPRKIFRYAAAAVTVGLITIIAWFFIRDNKTSGDYAANQGTAEEQVRQNITGISDTEIANFIDGGAGLYNLEAATSTGELAGDDVLLMLADVSDQELEKYLETHTPTKENYN